MAAYLDSRYSRSRTRSALTIATAIVMLAAHGSLLAPAAFFLWVGGWLRPRESVLVVLGFSYLIGLLEKAARVYVSALAYAVISTSARFRTSKLLGAPSHEWTTRSDDIQILPASKVSWPLLSLDALGRCEPELRWLLFPYLLLMRWLGPGKKTSLRIPTGNYTLS